MADFPLGVSHRVTIIDPDKPDRRVEIGTSPTTRSLSLVYVDSDGTETLIHMNNALADLVINELIEWTEEL